MNKAYFYHMKRELKGKRILVIGQVWPESRSSAAGKRMLQLLDCFNRWGMDIYFGSTAHPSEYSDDLSSFGVREVELWLNDERTDAVLEQLQPDIVMYDRFMIEEQFSWRVSQQCPNALTILDTEDLHFLRYARQEWNKKGEGNLEDYLYSDRTKREIAAILRTDASLLISDVEYDLLVATFGISPELLWVIPFMEKEVSKDQWQSWLPFQERKDFVFIGNFIHEPNYQTVLRLKKDIWPSLSKKLPNAQLNIYGAYPSQKVLQLHNEKQRFLVHGRTEDALEVIGKARILLAPIPFGAGIKGKFVDAMQVGTPSVTTKIGAEAMGKNDEWPGYITDDMSAFINRAIELYTNEKLWKEKQKTGIQLLNKEFATPKHSDIFFTLLTKRLGELKSFRQKNFLGEILRHHSALSTKYMALWIEEKNKKQD